MKFIIKGEFRMKGEKQKFCKEVAASKEKQAKEKIYADLGSNHKVKRRFIKVEEIKHAEK